MEHLDIVTVHYNTPEMMDCMIRSLNMRTVCRIHVIDNSDEEPFVNSFPNVDVIDNTKGQLIDFENWLLQFPERKPRMSNYGSPKHCKTVDLCFDLFPNGFILMDSDVLVKKDITSFWDERYAWVGEAHVDTPKGNRILRLLPFLCYINVPMIRKHGIRYFNAEWMWHLTARDPNRWYDTGAWFYRDVKRHYLPVKNVTIDRYIEHYFHGSHDMYNDTLDVWLEKHKDLWL